MGMFCLFALGLPLLERLKLLRQREQAQANAAADSSKLTPKEEMQVHKRFCSYLQRQGFIIIIRFFINELANISSSNLENQPSHHKIITKVEKKTFLTFNTSKKLL